MNSAHVSINDILNKIQKMIGIDIRYFLKGAFWLVSPNIFGAVLSLGLSILIANYIPKEIFGIYKYILSMASIAVAFSLSGMNTAIIQAVAKGAEGIFFQSIKVQIKWASLQSIFLLCVAMYYFIQGNSIFGIAFSIMAIFAPISTVSNSYSAYLSGKKDFKRSGIYSLWSSIIYFAGMTLAILFNPSVIGLVAAFYIASVISNLYFFYRTKKNYTPNTVFNPEDITYGKHLSAMNVFSIIATQIDNILVYHFLGPIELAIYNFALLIPERFRMILGFIPTLALPRLAEQSKTDFKAVYKKAVYLIIFVVGISIVYSLSAPLIFQIFFPQYLDAIPYTQVASFVLIAITSSYLLTSLIAQKSTKSLYTISIITPLIRIALIAVLISFYGIWGAIIARLLTHLIQLFITLKTSDTTI